MGAAQEPEELVEPPALRVKPGRAAQMPLADDSGHIASRLEAIGNRRLRKRQADVLGVCCPGVELMAEPLLVSARQETGSSGAAIWP